MPAKPRKKANRRRSKKQASGGIPAWFWLLTGILIGLGTAVALMFRGYLPELKQHIFSTDSKSPSTSEPALVEEESANAAEPKKPRYDFFTVLPEMEVVVPDRELDRKSEPTMDAMSDGGQNSYILQVGSFRNAADAEQMKARLALLGTVASVQSVTVNGQAWHRVRIGPFEGTRKTNDMRRLLSENQIDTLVMRANP